MSLKLRFLFTVLGGITAGLFSAMLVLLHLAHGSGVAVAISAGGVVISLLLCLAVSWEVSNLFRPNAPDELAAGSQAKDHLMSGARSNQG